MTKNYIPTINISTLIRDKFKTQNALKIIKKIEKACVEVGFFQVTGHGIEIKKINNICKIGNQFFSSSEENKKKLAPKKWNNKNKNLYRGYFLFNEIPSARTFIGVACIIAAGIYIYMRERVRDQYIATETPVRR